MRRRTRRRRRRRHRRRRRRRPPYHDVVDAIQSRHQLLELDDLSRGIGHATALHRTFPRARARVLRSVGPGRRDATTKTGAASPKTTTNDDGDDDDDGDDGGDDEDAPGNRWTGRALNTVPAILVLLLLLLLFIFHERWTADACLFISFSPRAHLFSLQHDVGRRDPTRGFWKPSRDTRSSLLNNRLRSLILHAAFVERYRSVPNRFIRTLN